MTTVHETNDPTLTENTDQQTDEERAQQAAKKEVEEKVAEMLKNGQKPILFEPPLTAEQANEITNALNRISDLRAKIDSTQEQVQKQYDEVEQRVRVLQEKKLINSEDNNQAKQSITRYLELLDRIAIEAGYEEELLRRYQALEVRTVIPVHLSEPNDFNGFLKNKVCTVKKQIKRIERDLNVSFSRYQFNFANQRNNLAYLEKIAHHQALLRKK